MRIRLKLWSLLCLLLTGQALQANAQDVVAVGAQITSESSIVSGKAYVVYYVGNGSSGYMKDTGTAYTGKDDSTPNERAVYYFTANGDGTWKVKNFYTGNYWGTPTSNDNSYIGTAAEDAAGSWALNFQSNGNIAPSCNSHSWNRSGSNVHPSSVGTINVNQLQIFEVPLSTTALSELISHDISIASETAATVETGQWYVMSQRTRSSYVYEDASTHTLKHTQTKPGGKATTNASYLVQLVSGTDGNYYIKNGLGNYIGQIIASTNVPTTALKEEQHAVQKINNTDGHYSVQCISNSVVLNANDFTLGDPATVVGWGTEVPTATGGNNDWAFYPVELIPTASEVYTLNNTNTNRGALVYNGTSNNVALVASANLNASNANHQWVLYPTATDGQYYLYNVGADKFAIPTSIAQDNQNAWVFSNNAVAVTLLNQGNGKFRIKMATNPVNGTNAAVLGVNIKLTPAVFNYNDAGSDFAFTLVEGANASTQVEAAVGRLITSLTPLNSYPQQSGWYAIQIRGKQNTAAYAGRFMQMAPQLYNNLYPLTFTGAINVQPAVTDPTFLTYISHTSWDVNTWQLPDGRYLVNNGNNKFPTPSLTAGNVLCGYSNGNYFKEANNYYADPYNNNANYFIGETTSMRTAYTVYPIDLEDAGLVPWKVNISENPSDRQVTCARNDVSGLTAVYNNGYFFLPDDVTPSASDFTTASYNGKTPDFVIDTENHLITVNYLFTSDKVYTITNTNEGATRGSLIYNPDNTKWVWASGKSGTFDASQANSQWVFIPTGTANQYYLYNVGAGKFAIPMKGGTYGNGNSYSWGFSDNAVAIKLIQQSDGSFKMYSVTHNVVISISTNYTGPVIFFDDNGAKFNISLVDGQNQSDVANAAKEKLVKNIPALTAVPTADDGWYVMQIRTSATSSHVGRYVYAAESEYTYNNVSYPLTFTGEIDVQPAVDDATFYTRLVKSGEYFYWQMPNGKFLKYYSSQFPISDATGSTILAGYDNGNYMKASGNYAVPCQDGTNFFIGKSTTYRTYYMYPIDLSTAGLTAWQVTISGGDADIKLVCNTTGVSGLNSVYNNGYIFLPTGTTPASSDFAYSDGANIYVEVDDTEKTILAVYNPDDEGIKTDNTQVIQGNETTGKGNTMQALLRVKLSPLTHSTPTSVEVALTGHDLLDKVAVYTTTIDEIHAEGANPQKVGEVTAGATVTIPVTMGTIRAGQTIYMWITGDVKSSATELATIDAAITSITYNNILGNSTVCDLSSVGNPDGVMKVFKQQTYLWTSQTSTPRYYRIPALLRISDTDILAFTDYRYDSTEDLGKPVSGHKIDVQMRKSTDGGLTWSDVKTVAAGDGSTAAGYGYGDPAVALTPNGRVVCLMAAGQKSYSSGMLHIGYTYSDNNGDTWSTVTDLYGSEQLTNPHSGELTSTFVSSGHGITQTIANVGRVAFTALGNISGTNIYTIYSDDNGDHWTFSENSGFNGNSADESKLEELNDGSLLMSVRRGGYNTTGMNRGYNRTTDTNIENWGTQGTWGDLVANGCNSDLLYYSRSINEEPDILLHTIVKAYSPYRKDLRLYMSVDQGNTWVEVCQLQPGYAAYSSMQKLANGDLAIIFEDGSIGNKDKMDCYAINYIVISKEQVSQWHSNTTNLYDLGANYDHSYVIKNYNTGAGERYIKSAKYNAAADLNVYRTNSEDEAAEMIILKDQDNDGFYYVYDLKSNYYLQGASNNSDGTAWTFSATPVTVKLVDNTPNHYDWTRTDGHFYLIKNSGDAMANAYSGPNGHQVKTYTDQGDAGTNWYFINTGNSTTSNVFFDPSALYRIRNLQNSSTYVQSVNDGTNLTYGAKETAGHFVLIPVVGQSGKYYFFETKSQTYLMSENSTMDGGQWTVSKSVPIALPLNNQLTRSVDENWKPRGIPVTLGLYYANPYGQTGFVKNYYYRDDAGSHWYLERVDNSTAALVDITGVSSNVQSLVESAALVGTQLQYTAKVGSAARGTVVIPFEADVTGDVEAYTLTAVDGNSNLQGTKVETIEANKPVLLKNSGTLVLTAKEGTLEYADAPVNGFLHGVYTPTQAPEGSYVLQKQGDVVAFFHVEDIHPTVGAFRAYLETPGNARMLTINFDGETTGINSIDNGQLIMDNGAVYDLQGRKVNLELTKGGETLPRGLYIINGKKVVIK